MEEHAFVNLKLKHIEGIRAPQKGQIFNKKSDEILLPFLVAPSTTVKM